MKHLAILGSTGSIGKNVLRIVEAYPDRFAVKALAGGQNVDLLAAQAKQFSPEVAVMMDDVLAYRLEKEVSPSQGVKVLYGPEGYKTAATLASVDLVVSAMAGSAGLLPTLAAVEHGKPVALANKESLVMAGDLLMDMARQKNVPVIPVDSEHSAVFQCLAGNRREDLKQILLTASGGPFFKKKRFEFGRGLSRGGVTPPQLEYGTENHHRFSHADEQGA